VHSIGQIVEYLSIFLFWQQDILREQPVFPGIFGRHGLALGRLQPF
jgi:hypothetical protein